MKSTSTIGKIFRFGLMLVMAVSLAGFFSGCKDREEDPHESLNVQFRVTSTTGVKLKAIVSQVGTVQNTTFFDPVLPNTPNSWNSEPLIVSSKEGAVHLSSTADGVDSDSELIVSIWINGERKAVDTAKGINLMAKTVVDFNN